MKPKNPESIKQHDLFRLELVNMINHRHELVKLSEQLNWDAVEAHLSQYLHADNGSPALPARLVAGLLYLEHLYNLSDEQVCQRWRENPYWQYFCGEQYFQHELPCHPTSLTKWRNRLGVQGVEFLFKQTIECALNQGIIDQKACEEVIVDTTVQEKNITYPTDTKLLENVRQKLVRLAQENEVVLRQNYNQVCRQLSWKIGQYGRVRQYKRMHKVIKQHRTRVGRVYRDIDSKMVDLSPLVQEKFASILAITKRLLAQEKQSKNKLYSVHAPEVECISKGKLKQKYEYGVKVSLAMTQSNGVIVGAMSCPGNPYDGHTLKAQVEQINRLTQARVKVCWVDKGYRGKQSAVEAVEIVHNGLNVKKMSRAKRKKLDRRNAIEPIIGHLKQDGKLGRNYLKGACGDAINVLLCAAGQNLRKLLRWFFFVLIFYTNFNRNYA